MRRTRVVPTTGDVPVFREITMKVLAWSIGTMRCCSIMLINHSIHVLSTLRFRLSAEMNFLLISSMCHSVFTVTGGPSASSNQYGPTMPLRPISRQTVTFSTRSGRYWCSWGWAWAQMRILYLFTWMKSNEWGWSLVRWLMVFLKTRLSDLFASVWSCKLSILHGNRRRSRCIVRITKLLERSVSWENVLWISLETASTVSHSYAVIFCPNWPCPATMTFILSCTLPVSLNVFWRRFTVSLVGIFLAECPSEIVVEFGQLISWRNRPLQQRSPNFLDAGPNSRSHQRPRAGLFCVLKKQKQQE